MMNKGTLISFFISLCTIGLVNQMYSQIIIETLDHPALASDFTTASTNTRDDEQKERVTLASSSHNQRCITPCTAEAKGSTLQATVDQIVQHVSILIESRPNSKKNIVVHLAAIISSIINCVAKIVACPNKKKDSFYHELNTKLQNVLTECTIDTEMEVDEIRTEDKETY